MKVLNFCFINQNRLVKCTNLLVTYRMHNYCSKEEVTF